MRRVGLADLVVDPEVAETDVADLDVRLRLTTTPTPETLRNLRRMHVLGVLDGDGVLALIGQANIDPHGLYGALRERHPEGWVFSAIDFSAVRVLSRDERGVIAALRVELMTDDVTVLRRDDKGRLVAWWGLVGEEVAAPGSTGLARLQEALEAAIAQ